MLAQSKSENANFSREIQVSYFSSNGKSLGLGTLSYQGELLKAG